MCRFWTETPRWCEVKVFCVDLPVERWWNGSESAHLCGHAKAKANPTLQTNRVGSESLFMSRRRASLCVLLMLFGSIDNHSWQFPRITSYRPNRTEPALIQAGSGKTSAFTGSHTLWIAAGGLRGSWWTGCGRTEPQRRGSAADWSQFLFLFGFEKVCAKAAQK